MLFLALYCRLEALLDLVMTLHFVVFGWIGDCFILACLQNENNLTFSLCAHNTANLLFACFHFLEKGNVRSSQGSSNLCSLDVLTTLLEYSGRLAVLTHIPWEFAGAKAWTQFKASSSFRWWLISNKNVSCISPHGRRMLYNHWNQPT